MGSNVGAYGANANKKATSTPFSIAAFKNPADNARPGVYWYFMDGNFTKEGVTKDLEAMKKAGIGYVIFLEVNVGIPRGPLNFMSDPWLDNFKYLVNECKRLGISITLGIGPGWTGSGGPWVKGEESMQHLVSTSVTVNGTGKQVIKLPVPEPKNPFFGSADFSAEMMKNWKGFYRDVAVLAFPTPKKQLLADSEEKALYYRAPYSSAPGVKQFLPTIDAYNLDTDPLAVIDKTKVIDLTSLLQPDGSIEWDVPKGEWTVMRFGSRNNGAVTRPAPFPGIGMECDKFDTLAVKDHFANFIDKLFKAVDGKLNTPGGGLKMLHMDSWEMGAQNWTSHFRQEFIKRRGYDPLPFYPVYSGMIVQSREISERFLWDLRLTSQELILENHAGYVKKYSHDHGLGLSIEPYDMNPTSDLELGAVADMPMCEFWSNGYGFETSFSAVEGTSDAHIIGQPVVPSESFTAANDLWRQYPGSMKDQTDWAFATGINRLMFHTFQHQCLPDSLKPGMTMGIYGVHWDRNQTWWPMATGYHKYVARCQYMLQQGRTVADILYLAPEGAPHVFRAPKSAFEGETPNMPDRKCYNFDGCPPSLLYSARVVNGSIVFPGGASYRVLVLPDNKTVTPRLLNKVYELILDGATVIGNPPVKSPSLVGYPACDDEVQQIAAKIWQNGTSAISKVGKGAVVPCGGDLDNLYQPYPNTVEVLKSIGALPDFISSTGYIRYTHRTTSNGEIYFIANRTDKDVLANCTFRVSNRQPELWNPMNGSVRRLSNYTFNDGTTTIPLKLEGHESYFIVFNQSAKQSRHSSARNYDSFSLVEELEGPWNVSFDVKWGGPKSVTFAKLQDWAKSDNDGIKYYSGIAVYEKTFNMSGVNKATKYFIDLNKVQVMAHVWLNGVDMGIVWTNPFRLEITSALKSGTNKLRIAVANLWPNRLIGDQQFPDDGIAGGKWPEWLLDGKPRPSKRVAFSTYNTFKKNDALLESGLIGPVDILKTNNRLK
jgi:hypothetical protein